MSITATFDEAFFTRSAAVGRRGGITALFDDPYYTGVTTSAEVPDRFPVAIGTRPFVIDTKEGVKWNSIPLLRTQADTSNLPDEGSLNPDDLWRRSAESWHRGAGQTHLDRPDSDPARFRSSKGVDPWERWQLSLLPDTARKRTAAFSSFNAVLAARGYLYVSDGGYDLYWTDDITAATPTWTAANINAGETPAVVVTAMATDGRNVWTVMAGSGGIHRTLVGSTASTHYSDLNVNGPISYVKGRLMAANNGRIYNITAPGAAPTALYNHPDPVSFSFVGFAEGPAHIYAAGYIGDYSTIYKMAVKPDGTALDTPTVAGRLPDGERVRAIYGYLGFILLGTGKGVRLAQPDANGDLTMGSLIRTPNIVECFEGQDRFVWFGMSDYDGTSTGLGRLDLSQFTQPLTPAWASDVMATTQGDVVSVVTADNRRVFAVSGVGIYATTDELVPSGTLDSGLITYGLAGEKVAAFVDVRHQALVGSHREYLSTDGKDFAVVGADSAVGKTSDVFPAGPSRGENFELRTELSRSTDDATTGPVITRVGLRANPAPRRGQILTVPFLLADRVTDLSNADVDRDAAGDLAFLVDLWQTHRLVAYQEGLRRFDVFLEDYQWVAHHLTQDRRAWVGTFFARLKAVME